MSFAQELHTIYKVKKAEQLENREVIQARREKDIKLFFEKEVREGAKDKMKARAEAGRPTANVLEYQYNERFYINGEEVCRYIDQEVQYPNYRIHDVVMRDVVFQELLTEFETEISSEENKIRLTRWRPRDTLHVVEAVWGRNRYHNANRFRTAEGSEGGSDFVPVGPRRTGGGERGPGYGRPPPPMRTTRLSK